MNVYNTDLKEIESAANDDEITTLWLGKRELVLRNAEANHESGRALALAESFGCEILSRGSDIHIRPPTVETDGGVDEDADADPRVMTDRPLMASDRADECDDCAYAVALGAELPCFECYCRFSQYDREKAARELFGRWEDEEVAQ